MKTSFNTTNKTLLICTLINIGIILLWCLFWGNHLPLMASIGLVNVVTSGIYFLLGVILLFFQESRSVGQGLLLAAGIFFLIGCSVCFIEYR